MDPKIPAVFNWSGGKDSALALYRILQEGVYEVVSLLTTVSRDTRRSPMHGIPIWLLRRQAGSIGLPLEVVEFPANGSMEEYEAAMSEAVDRFKELGVRHFIFGDICLEDVRAYRERRLASCGITVVEPLWGRDTKAVAEEFFASGLRTVVVTTNAALLDERFVGREYDRAFVAELPEGVDPCGRTGSSTRFAMRAGCSVSLSNFRWGNPCAAPIRPNWRTAPCRNTPIVPPTSFCRRIPEVGTVRCAVSCICFRRYAQDSLSGQKKNTLSLEQCVFDV